MSPWLKHCTLALFGTTIGIAASSATADPLDPAHVPADSRWIVHVDMDTAQKSAAWKEIYERLQRNPDFEDKLADLETVFKAHFPEDLHDATVCGSAFGDEDAVVLVHANVDRKQVETVVAGSANYSSTPQGDHALLSWEDDGQIKYGGFVNDSLYIVGQSKDRVAAMFDVLDGKAAALKADAALAKGAHAGVMVYVAGDEIAKLRQMNKAQSPLLGQMKSAWLSLSEEKEETIVRLSVDANDAATAAQMQQAAEGIRAMLNLAAGGEDAKPIMKELANVLAGAQIVVKENTVSVECRVPNKQIPDLLDQAMAAREAAAKTVTRSH